MTAFDQVGEELKEKSDQEQSDMHAIDIGIGREDDPVVAEVFDAVFDVEAILKKIEFLVFVDDFFGETEAIQRFPLQAENGQIGRASCRESGQQAACAEDVEHI